MKSKFLRALGLIAIAVATSLVACNEDPEVKDDGTPRVLTVHIDSHEGNTLESCLVAPKDTTVMINVRLNKGSADNLVVKLDVDLDLLAKYNEDNGTSYSILPADAYEFTVREAILPRYNTQSSSVSLRLLSGKLPDAEVYLLPVTVTEVSGNGNIGVDEEDGMIFILFSKADVPELKFVELTDIVLTTEIGAGKHNWFSAYKEPHVFDVETAAAYSDMMDFVLVPVNASSDTRFYGAQMGSFYGGQYETRIAPYTSGFSYLTFTGIGSPLHTKEEYDAISSYDDMLAFIKSYKTSSNYDYELKLDRMQSNPLAKDKAVITTWGAKFNAKGYAMYLIKDVKVNNGIYTVTFNVKYFEQNFRKEYNSLAIEEIEVPEPTAWEAALNIEGADGNTVTKSLVPPEEATVRLNVSLDNDAPDALTVKFKVDESLIAEYNTANSTDYALVPADAYEFAVKETSVAKGSKESGAVAIKLLSDKLPDYETYLLPVSVDQITGHDDVTVDADQNAAYILFSKVDTKPKLIELKDIAITTEIGTGKYSWFSAYKEPHVFDVATAAQNCEMMDFALVRHGTGDIRFYGPHMGANGYGAAYDKRMAPYTKGFTKLPYLGIGGKKHPKADYENLVYEDDLLELIETYKGEPIKYNYETGLDRMQSDKLEADVAIISTWGAIKNAKGYAMYLIKKVETTGDHTTVTFDAKIFAEDLRTKYNSIAMKDVVPAKLSIAAEGNVANDYSVTVVPPAGSNAAVKLNATLDKVGYLSDAVVSFDADESLVAAYNTANKTSYTMLPAAAYSFDTKQATIVKEGATSDFVTVTLTSDALAADKAYMLPVKITGATGDDSYEPGPNNTAYIIVYKPQSLVELTDITLTTEVGAGKNNWFSAYKAPHVFDVATAAQHSDMMDFVLVPVSASATHFYGPQMGTFYGNAYATRIEPYTTGFDKLPFTGLGSKLHDKADYEALEDYSDLLALIETYKGEPLKYDYELKIDRMQSAALAKDKFVICLWGAKYNAQGYAAFLIKDIQVSEGIFTVTFDVKLFPFDFRTAFNPMAIETVE